MTRARQPKPTAPPLAVTLRAALASDWRTLAALDTLAGARGSDARRLVHEALRGLRVEGCVLEERVGRGGVEVRLAPAVVDAEAVEQAKLRAGIDEAYALDRAALDFLPHEAEPIADPGPIPGVRYGLSSEQIAEMGGPEGVEAIFAETDGEPMDIDAFQARAEAYLEAAAPAPPVGQAAPVEAVGGPVAPSRDGSRRVSVLAAHLAHYGHVEEAREIEGLPPAPKGPGPSSRCATCAQTFAYHEQHGPIVIGHRFQPKPRGRPRARLAAAQAADPDVEELPTPAEQAAILDGMREQWDAAVAEHRAGAEPETSRGEAPGEQDHGEQGKEQGTDVERTAAEPSGAGARASEGCSARGNERGGDDHPDGQRAPALEAGGQDQGRGARLPRGRGKAVEPVGLKPSGCRPPLCHADSIHEPARVRSFARPLCETHRRWVEGAGGSVASGADTAALHPGETV